MKRSLVLVIIVVIAALLAAPAWNFQDKKPIAAYIIKVVKDVERRSGKTEGWSKALAAAELKAGYEVRTQEKSLALIKFADDSKVTVRPKSILTIQGEMQGGKILNRDIYIERGRALFDIKKQEKEEQFRFTSPISVASIRGTEGGTGFDPSFNFADIIIITGLAEFSSSRTGCQVQVGAGMSGSVDSTGACRTDTATTRQLNSNNPVTGMDQDTTRAGGTQPTPTTTATFTLSTPGGSLESGKGAKIEVAYANAPTEITQATMFYRVQGTPSYSQVTMTQSAGKLTGDVPAAQIRAGTTKTFEYYFSLVGANGTTYTFPETDPAASPYTMPIKPTIVYIRIPITTPSGQEQYLLISYEQ